VIRAELERVRDDAAHERDQLQQSHAAQLEVLTEARADLRARAEHAESETQRALAAHDEVTRRAAADTAALAGLRDAVRSVLVAYQQTQPGAGLEALAEVLDQLREHAGFPTGSSRPGDPGRRQRS
jgi:phytoene/squalene synthetase